MENPSKPLADYFWIAGIETISYNDGTPLPSPTPAVDAPTTIVEDGEEHEHEHERELERERENEHAQHDDAENAVKEIHVQSKATARHSRQTSANRLSRISIHTLEEIDVNTRSNRSSAATLKPTSFSTPSSPTNPTAPIDAAAPGSTAPNGTAPTRPTSPNDAPAALGVPTATPNITIDEDGTVSPFAGLGLDHLASMPDFDFDKALLKFAAERENFLEDLTFSAGAKVQARPPMVSPRLDRIKGDDASDMRRNNPLRSIKGSIRRKISFRDMTSVRKQPLTPKPAASVRTARRLSSYNSVIPPPEPLNTDPDMHPLKRRFEPVLLDRYPPRDMSDEMSRRGKFPDYVPMFAFPNDIQIVSSDDRPRSTWHGFTMTSDDNSKIHGITIIVWTALTAHIAEDVERRCEQWRQGHMSNEERELAASLGIRLARERTVLSQLLAKLGTIQSGTTARDALEDQISAVEEKISLMTDMLRPLRHGAASKIDGLTTGESGLWVPRAFGILGRDATKMSFWKEWLRAIVVPMTDGAVLRVPPTSPRVGRWQPMERYVINLCTEAFSPLGSMTQVELGVRELRLHARREAANEIPGARTIDLYALFRCLSLENIVALFEFAMSESRIIFLSSHAAMLHLACHALASLLYPLKWASIFIPILPARLLSALEAPCPYVVGVERRYERIDLPEDDYVLVDLDRDTIDATVQPHRLPRQHRRKLMSLLQHAAPHRLRYGVASGPPPYAVESFPYDAFSAENQSLFTGSSTPSTLGKWVSQNSSTFGELEPKSEGRKPLFNAFSAVKLDPPPTSRPDTSKSSKTSPPSSVSPKSITFPASQMPSTPVSMSDSGFALTSTLKEKRSGHFDDRSRRSSSFGMEKHAQASRPNMPFIGHQASLSVSAISIDSQTSLGGAGCTAGYAGYAPSMYAPSTLAASTVMPNMLIQPVCNTETTVWVEGHQFEWHANDYTSACTVCDDRAEGDGIYTCNGCACMAHGRCLGFVALVCPDTFHEDRVRAAFVRCLASLLYTYRKHLVRPSKEAKANGKLYSFDMGGFIKSLPYEQQEYAMMMRDTQAFNEFIHEREVKPTTDPSIRLFDEIVMAKKARGRPGLASGISRLSTIRSSHRASLHPPSSMPPPAGGRAAKVPNFLADHTDHIWRTASVPVPNGKFPGEYHDVVTRIPMRLDPLYMREPRAIQGVPRPEQRGNRGLVRKRVPSMLGTTPPS